MRRWIRPLLAVALVLGLLWAASALRAHSGVEISGDALDQLSAFVVSLGGWAPVLFLGVATFRVFFVVPSWILLTVGGIAFGAFWGALLGTLGVTASGILGFGLARLGGRGSVRRWVELRFGEHRERVEKAGLAVLAATTAHPAVPMSGLHWAAGLTSLPLLGFVLAVGMGAAIRSTVLAFLGASFVELGWARSLALAVGFCAIGALPLLHARTRQRLLGRTRRSA